MGDSKISKVTGCWINVTQKQSLGFFLNSRQLFPCISASVSPPFFWSIDINTYVSMRVCQNRNDTNRDGFQGAGRELSLFRLQTTVLILPRLMKNRNATEECSSRKVCTLEQKWKTFYCDWVEIITTVEPHYGLNRFLRLSTYHLTFFFFFWAMLHSLWNLSSLTRDWTWALSSESAES